MLTHVNQKLGNHINKIKKYQKTENNKLNTHRYSLRLLRGGVFVSR